FTKSSRTTSSEAFTGKSPTTGCQVLPRSPVRKIIGRSSPVRYAFVATYATFGSTFDGSIRTTHCPRAGSGKLLVSSVHLPPSFSVIQRRPSSVPAQSNPARLGDSATEKTTPELSAPLPTAFVLFGSLCVRAGLITEYFSIRSVSLKTQLPPR